MRKMPRPGAANTGSELKGNSSSQLSRSSKSNLERKDLNSCGQSDRGRSA
jgi:hypothetical protein